MPPTKSVVVAVVLVGAGRESRVCLVLQGTVPARARRAAASTVESRTKSPKTNSRPDSNSQASAPASVLARLPSQRAPTKRRNSSSKALKAVSCTAPPTPPPTAVVLRALVACVLVATLMATASLPNSPVHPAAPLACVFVCCLPAGVWVSWQAHSLDLFPPVTASSAPDLHGYTLVCKLIICYRHHTSQSRMKRTCTRICVESGGGQQ